MRESLSARGIRTRDSGAPAAPIGPVAEAARGHPSKGQQGTSGAKRTGSRGQVCAKRRHLGGHAIKGELGASGAIRIRSRGQNCAKRRQHGGNRTGDSGAPEAPQKQRTIVREARAARGHPSRRQQGTSGAKRTSSRGQKIYIYL